VASGGVRGGVGSAAERARFALLYDEGFAKPKSKRRKKRKLTPEGRAKIAEAVRRRWAAQKAAEKKATK